MRRLILPLLLLFVVGLAIGVSFTQSPSINNGVTTYTDDDLVCSWNMSDVTSVNVTWYKNGTFYSSENVGLNTSSTISNAVTQRDQNWTCNVTLFNGTNSTTLPAQVTIENSRPTTEGSGAGVFNQETSTDVGFTITIDENKVLTLDVNAIDADGETLRYLPADYFCTRLSQTLGTYQCAPTHDDILNGSGPGEEPKEVEIAFTASDGDLVGGRDILFQVIPVNDPPLLTIPDQSTNISALFNETFNASDEEEDYPLNASVVSALTDGNISGSVSATVEGNQTVRIVYPTTGIDYTDVGNRTVTINLTDARNASKLVNFTLEILTVNRPPYFTNISPSRFNTSLNQTYVLNQGQNITIDLSANDPETETGNVTLNFNSSAFFNVVPIITLATNETDALGLINWTPTNGDVGNHTVIITVSDQQASKTTTLNFTINNVNDAPVINNESHDSENTAGNVNITDLVTYLEAPFRYQINVTDADLDLSSPWGCEHLNWTDNASEFNITSGTGCGEAGGLISFTPSGVERNISVNITVTDVEGRSDSRLILIEMLNNTAPTLEPLPQWNTSEGNLSTYNLSQYANDTDYPGDYVADYSVEVIGTNLSGLSVNATSGLITYLPIQDQIGNYTANVTVTDTRGASASRLLNITVNNTEDYPVWTAWDFGNETIVDSHPFSFPLEATDKDLLIANSTENLTFAANLSWITIAKGNTSGDAVPATLLFMPNTSLVGDWSVQLNVTDTTGRTNSTTVAFTILNRSQPPNITAFKPYGDASNNSLVRSWKAVSGAATQENVSLSENTSAVVFAVNATDDDFAGPPYTWLNYTWYYDGEIVQGPSSTSNLTRSFGFFSSGDHVLAVMVNDSKLESSSWTWNLNITNVNRPPTFPVNFTGTKNNLSISETNNFNNYFVLEPSNGGFYDPDDDTNENSLIDGSEELNLTYTVSNCQYASFNFDGNNLEVTPLTVGTCYVTFNATDPHGASVESNLVEVTVTEVPQGAESTIVSSGGGGGGTSTRSTFIPFETEVETPEPLNLIAPKLVTIYDNQTVKVPLLLRNNWTAPLKSILLDATSNHTGVDVSFDTDYVEQLDTNATKEVMMTVSGYRLGENFEVVVSANVSDPSFEDTAMILFNSIEQSSEGDAVSVKVTFAKDLLSEHDECQELNELLFKADAQLKTGNVDSAKKMVDVVINGCKYLLSKTQEETQRPGIVKTPLIEMSEETLRLISYIALGVFLIIALLGMFYYHHKTKEDYDF